MLDSQSVKTSPVRGNTKGYDAAKKILGRKRHLLVDTQGLLLGVKVLAAGPYGPDKRERAVVATTDPQTLPDLTTWYLVTNLPAPTEGIRQLREGPVVSPLENMLAYLHFLT